MMAQVQPSSAGHGMRPTTPPKQLPLKIPRLSPSRMPDQLITSSYKNGHMNLDTFSPVNQNGSFEFDRVLRSGKVHRRVKKKGAWKPSWKQAYLVLRPNLLSIYKNDDETELRASITLTDVTAVARVKKTNTDHVFGVFTPAKNYHFSGIDERDTSDWVSVLRLESRLETDADLDLHVPEFPPPDKHTAGSDTTDLSAEDDFDAPGSPEGPQWSVRGNKSRVGSTSQRKPSALREYSGNETFTTSQSDLSDANPQSASAWPGSFSRSKSQLTPIPDGALPVSRPSFQRSASALSIAQSQNQAPSQQVQQQILQEKDPNRVIRQTYIQLLKSVPGTGVRQWKQVWAVLRPSALSLYKTNSEYEPLKIVPVSDLVDAVETDPMSKSKRFCFQVICLAKTFRLCVETEAELDGWLGALKSVLAAKKTGARVRGLSASNAAIPSAGTAMNTTGGPVGGGLLNNTAVMEGTGPAAGIAQAQSQAQTYNALATVTNRETSPNQIQGRSSLQLQRTGVELDGILETIENTNITDASGVATRGIKGPS